VIKMVRRSIVISVVKKVVSLRHFIFVSSIATQTIANIVRALWGRLGLDKMLVDNIGVRVVLSHLLNDSACHPNAY